jgi:hypothetical protein
MPIGQISAAANNGSTPKKSAVKCATKSLAFSTSAFNIHFARSASSDGGARAAPKIGASSTF